GSLFVFFNRPPASPLESPPQRTAAPPPAPRPPPRASATATPAPRETATATSAARESSDEELFRKSLPLTFTAKHSHRIGSCTGARRLEDWGVEFRSREHDPWRWRFGEIRALERENARSLHVEAGGKDYNFSF